MDTLEMVRKFHDAFGVENRRSPAIWHDAFGELRVELLKEELLELEVAIHCRNLVAMLDALLDLQYVLDGSFLQLGFAKYKEAGFKEVHRSNMSKLGPDGNPIKRDDGKVLKGPNFTPPDLERVMREIDNRIQR